MVGLYFNTKNMSAILKALQNRKSVELKSEVVELGLVENIQKASDSSRKLTESLRESNKSMNDADVAKKELEKEFAKVQKTLEKEQDKFFKLESRVDPMLTKMKDLLDKIDIESADVDSLDETDSIINYIEAMDKYKKDILFHCK